MRVACRRVCTPVGAVAVGIISVPAALAQSPASAVARSRWGTRTHSRGDSVDSAADAKSRDAEAENTYRGLRVARGEEK